MNLKISLIIILLTLDSCRFISQKYRDSEDLSDIALQRQKLYHSNYEGLDLHHKPHYNDGDY